MIKSLPAIEKEFDMKEVEKANPGWVRVVLGMFVLVVIMTSVWVDWARAGSFFQEAVQSWNQFKHDYGEYQKMDPFDKHGNLQQGNIRNYMEEKSSGTTQTETIRKNKNTVVHTPGKGPKTKCFPTTKVKT
ncbi:MAG: hypothetical protein HKO91_09115, partial [Desulfobacterales bacterium]|nr:hypothetical protein [Desulfobacterales bacterium]